MTETQKTPRIDHLAIVSASVLLLSSAQRRALPKSKQDEVQNILELEFGDVADDGSRLLAEITFQHSELQCPKCTATIVQRLGNNQGLRCGQCGAQFKDEDMRHQVYVTGIADDALVLLAAKKLAPGEQKQENPSGNEWKKVAAFADADLGLFTEIWTVSKAKPVSTVSISLNKAEDVLDRSTSVSATISALAFIADEPKAEQAKG